MVFSSIDFLFLFLPVCLLAHHLALRSSIRAANLVLLIFSLAFYLVGARWYVLLMLVSSAVDFVAAIFIGRQWEQNDLDRHAGPNTRQKILLAVALAINLGLLAWYKYATPAILGLNALWASTGLAGSLPAPNVLLPIGISFYTFQSMSYSIDVFRRTVTYTKSPVDFFAFVALFPQLIAGPIVRYVEVARELVERRVSPEGLEAGTKRFITGLAKKVLVANLVGEIADGVFFKTTGFTFDESLVATLAYGIQIYFDFSGYSDMAIGLGMMLGFRFPENFNFPYSATTIHDFWRRWHISLSTWFRDYLFIPLGGSRSGSARTAMNLFIVFFLCGLWHGASVRFIVWGLFHGCFLAMERVVDVARLLRFRVLQKMYVLIVVGAGWILFRSDTMAQAGELLRGFFSARWSTAGLFSDRPLLLGVTLACLFGFAAPAQAIERWVRERRNIDAAVHVALLVASIVLMVGQAYNPFIYFRF